jgi:PAS domain-containing protein
LGLGEESVSTPPPAPNGQQVAQILASIDEAVYSFDRAWRLTYLNRKAEQLQGQQLAKHVGRTFQEVFPRAVGTIFDREAHRAMADRQLVTLKREIACRRNG